MVGKGCGCHEERRSGESVDWADQGVAVAVSDRAESLLAVAAAYLLQARNGMVCQPGDQLDIADSGT